MDRQIMRIALFVAAAAVLGGWAPAQIDRGAADDTPLTLPELKQNDVVVEEIPYDFALPTNTVAKVDEEVLDQGDLLKELLKANVSAIANVLLTSKMVEIEMQREDIAVSDEEAEEELDAMMPMLAPGKTREELFESGVYSKSYLMGTARMQRGWKKLFWKAKNIPEDQRSNQTNQLLMQVYVSEVKNRYQLAVRGQKPAPPKGAIASLNTIVEGKRVSYTVSPVEAMEFLVGLLRPASIITGQTSMIDNYLVSRALDRADTSVSDSEVEGWVREMVDKYPPPFTWETILKIKGTSPDQERVRWRNVQAWKRSQGIEISLAELDAFRKEHDDFFRSRHVKVSHILLKFIDDTTGLSAGPEVEARAREKAERIHQLVREGVDFKRLAELYSDDATTAKSGGTIGQPIKKWGGGYDSAFQDVAYRMEKDDVSEPIKSSYGYHIILCNEVSPATSREIDWAEERYAEWILEEYETHQMDAWLNGMRAAATIEKSSPEQLMKIKDVQFPRKIGN